MGEASQEGFCLANSHPGITCVKQRIYVQWQVGVGVAFKVEGSIYVLSVASFKVDLIGFEGTR